MDKCYTPCIYYREIIDLNKKPMADVSCNYLEGKKLKDIPQEEKCNCKYFKTYKDIEEAYKNIQ